MKSNIVPPSKAAAGLCESCANAVPDHINVVTNPTMAPNTENRHKRALIRMSSLGGKIRAPQAYSPGLRASICLGRYGNYFYVRLCLADDPKAPQAPKRRPFSSAAYGTSKL